MKEEICQRSFSGWGFYHNKCVCLSFVYMMIDLCDHSVTPTPYEGGICSTVYLFDECSPPLQNLYDSIKNEPFKIPEDDGNDLTHTFFNPDREGWLLKLGMCIRSHKCNLYVYLCQENLNIGLWRSALYVPGDECLCCLFVYNVFIMGLGSNG